MKFPVAIFLFLGLKMAMAQTVFNLYDGPAPGSENWSLTEFEEMRPGNIKFVRNVTTPTLTAFFPKKNWNGTSVIVCPGGAYLGLAIDHEGTEIAEWLNSIGVTAFVLKYRVANETQVFHDRVGGFFGKKEYARADSMLAPYAKLAIDDGLEAVRFVRKNAEKFKIAPDRIGMMGFSAGGNLVAGVAQRYDAAARPDFIAPIYGYLFSVLAEKVPSDAPPCFQSLAADDAIADACIDFYKKWHDAGRPAEIHVFPKGGHGFGLKKQHLPMDLWPDRFKDWLNREGYLMAPDFFKKSNLDGNWDWHQYWHKMIETDWGGLARYQLANAKLAQPKKGKRVVFFGDSITEGWPNADSSFFKKNGYIGRGIGGQTTPQMLVRFRQDVLNLRPTTVVILAGTNDIAENMGPISLEAIAGNLASMAELAKANGIKPVLCSVLPAFDYPWRPGLMPNEKIPKLNALLKNYCEKNGVTYLDYFSKMADARMGLPVELAADGVHPTAAGYQVMAEMVGEIIKN